MLSLQQTIDTLSILTHNFVVFQCLDFSMLYKRHVSKFVHHINHFTLLIIPQDINFHLGVTKNSTVWQWQSSFSCLTFVFIVKGMIIYCKRRTIFYIVSFLGWWKLFIAKLCSVIDSNFHYPTSIHSGFKDLTRDSVI